MRNPVPRLVGTGEMVPISTTVAIFRRRRISTVLNGMHNNIKVERDELYPENKTRSHTVRQRLFS